jgi:lysozyme family protein
MIRNFEPSLQHVLAAEGGWVDDPKDPGGATMKGVTLATFRNHFGKDLTKDDLRRISDPDLKHIYRVGYWDLCQCDMLAPGIDYAVFDAAVNSGGRRAVAWLQEALGMSPKGQDGIMGPQTLSATGFATTTHADRVGLLRRMTDIRMEFLRGLKHWPRFGRGWTTRVETVRDEAVRMSYAAVAVPSPPLKEDDIPVVEEVNPEVFFVPGINAFCGTCAARAAPDKGGTVLTCRMQPPTHEGWPVVLASQWCMQWMARQGPRLEPIQEPHHE